MDICVLCVCLVPVEAKEDTVSSGSGIKDGCELHVGAGN